MKASPVIEPSHSLGITLVGLAHVDLLSALHGRCFTPGWHAATFMQSLVSPGAFALLAEADRNGRPEPVGFMLARAVGGESEILSLGVVPAARRGGIARRLLTAGTTRAASAGAQALFLEVAESNLPARELYQQAGFHIVGRRPDYYRLPGGGGEAALVMRRDLTA
jgi:ribosomal-protein-alanine N-acetyltransferase